MNLAEQGIPFRELEYPLITTLRRSTGPLHRRNHVPLEDALWFERSSRLTLDMKTSKALQGFPGNAHGGMESFIIDDVGGSAGSIWAAIRGKMVLTQELNVQYYRPLKIAGIPIHIEADLERRGRSPLLHAWVSIARIEDGALVADGHVKLRIVDKIR